MMVFMHEVYAQGLPKRGVLTNQVLTKQVPLYNTGLLIQCNLSSPGSLGPRGACNCESARKYESSTTCVDFETFHTLNILFSLISFKQ